MGWLLPAHFYTSTRFACITFWEMIWLDKRLQVALLSGAVLGVVCIVGASLRSAEALGGTYLLAFWYNRVLMGLMIGAFSGVPFLTKGAVRGAVLGLLVSFAFYSATGFADPVGFWVGPVYGILIEYAAHRWEA